MQSKKWKLEANDFDEKMNLSDHMKASSSDSEDESEYKSESSYGYGQDNWWNHDNGLGFTETDFKKLAMAARSLKRTQRIDIEFLL